MGIGNIADSGMQAAMSNMEVISNNIANADTIGFKKSYINFADVFPSSNGASGNGIGMGVNVSSVLQDFTNGSNAPGVGPLDVSIAGGGFFILKNPTSGQVSYSRAGRFQYQNGYIMSGSQRLQGFPATNGVVNPSGTVSDIQVPSASIPATATTSINIQVNLSSADAIPAVTPFDPTNKASYNYITPGTIYDSLGNSHSVQSYYVNTGNNTWDVNVYVDNVAAGSGSVSFSSNGTMLSSTGLNALSYAPTTGATTPQAFTIDMTGSTQFGTPDSPIGFQANGNLPGTFTNDVNIDENGNVLMTYSNGMQVIAGQIALATFQSPQGMTDIGNSQFMATTNSGAANVANATSTNNFSPNQIESSNVDLTTEMVNLIDAQHTFQANAQVEQVYNEVMNTVIKL